MSGALTAAGVERPNGAPGQQVHDHKQQPGPRGKLRERPLRLHSAFAHRPGNVQHPYRRGEQASPQRDQPRSARSLRARSAPTSQILTPAGEASACGWPASAPASPGCDVGAPVASRSGRQIRHRPQRRGQPLRRSTRRGRLRRPMPIGLPQPHNRAAPPATCPAPYRSYAPSRPARCRATRYARTGAASGTTNTHLACHALHPFVGRAHRAHELHLELFLRAVRRPHLPLNPRKRLLAARCNPRRVRLRDRHCRPAEPHEAAGHPTPRGSRSPPPQGSARGRSAPPDSAPLHPPRSRRSERNTARKSFRPTTTSR